MAQVIPATFDQDLDYVHDASQQVMVQLTPQEERFLTLHCNGFGAHAAARYAGMAPSAGRALLEDPRVAALVEYMREAHADAVNVTREMVSVMLLESHRKAASATDEIAAARELGKLHGLYKSDEQKGTKITNNTQINGDVAIGARKLARLTTEQLIQMAQLPDNGE